MRPRSRPNDLSSRPHGPQGINILRDGSRLVLGTERVRSCIDKWTSTFRRFMQLIITLQRFDIIYQIVAVLLFRCLTLIIMLQILGLASAEVGWAIRYCPLLPLVSDCSDICLAPETDSKSNGLMLSRTDPRDALRENSHCPVHAKADARCDKMAMVVGRTKLTTLETVDTSWGNLLRIIVFSACEICLWLRAV